MTILLADDEKSICEYLRTLVNWSAYGYTFLTVENGQAALDMIHTRSVDLLLLDITMPVMNGLEVLEQLSIEKNECIVTLLTCHDEFEYVQKALRYNCFDYVLKSAIDSNNILELIERMHTQLSEDAREHHAYEKLSIAKRQQEEQATQQIVCDWLRTNYAPRDGILSHMEHHLDFKNGNTRYVLLCVVLTNYLEAISRYTDGNTAQFSNVIDGVLRELLEQHHFFYVQAENDSFLIFLCYDYRSNLQTVMASTQSLADQIINSFHHILRIEAASIYSLPFPDFEQSRTVYHKMAALAEMRYYGSLEKASCIDDYSVPCDISKDVLCLFESTLCAERDARSLVGIELCLNRFLSDVITHRILIPRKEFLSLCSRSLQAFLPNAESFSAAEEAPDVHAAISAILKIVQPFCLSIDKQDKKLMVKKAILLIQQSFMNESLNLEWLASQLWINASYLSRLFSEEVGQSITSYISNYRIEQAKKLIVESNLKLYEIAAQTGFSSPIVFSTSFKKATGQTPSDYRERSF